jgi:hypothetical protein
MPNVVNTLKKNADLLSLPTLAAKELLALFNPQNKNLFEMVILPENLSLSNVGWAVLDTAMTTVYVQSIDMGFFEVEYTRYNHEQVASGIEFPEDISINFIENEESFVRLYLQKWMAETVALRTFSGIPGDYVFADNQDGAKKTALIIPQMTTGAPSVCWIKLTGLRFKSMEAWDLSQESGEPLYIKVKCAVDNVQLYSPLSPHI